MAGHLKAVANRLRRKMFYLRASDAGDINIRFADCIFTNVCTQTWATATGGIDKENADKVSKVNAVYENCVFNTTNAIRAVIDAGCWNSQSVYTIRDCTFNLTTSRKGFTVISADYQPNYVITGNTATITSNNGDAYFFENKNSVHQCEQATIEKNNLTGFAENPVLLIN